MTYDEVKKVLQYDPSTGVLTWLAPTSRKFKKGDVVGSHDSDGYLIVRIRGITYKQHRLAWLYMTGAWPAHQVDHANGIRDDNRWINLREATQSQNSMNAKPKGVSGIRGVDWLNREKRWRVMIHGSGKRIIVGYFKEFQDAANAAKMAREQHHREFTLENRNGSQTCL